jgi:hypothetical protein
LDTSAGRDTLLPGLPTALRNGVERDGAKVTDLDHILAACEAWSPGPGETSPVVQLVQNALPLTTGSIYEQTLLDLLEAIQRPRPLPPCPYRGLFAFREDDALFFFGRKRFIEGEEGRGGLLAAQSKPRVAVLGPSGSGKSSVVFAGLVPRLRTQPGWLIAPTSEGYAFRPGDRPLRNLAAALLPLLDAGLSETDRLVETGKLETAPAQRHDNRGRWWPHVSAKSTPPPPGCC